MLTITDLFCGAGGSSSGAELVPGVRVVMAANHWRLAVDTHNTNLPHADHDCADVSQVDPGRYPPTDVLWASPSCTHHSKAQGKKKAAQPSLFDPPATDDDTAGERSRATMWDVCRFAEHHRYPAVVVENVVDVRGWVMWPAWRHALDCLGYHTRTVYLNSMHAAGLGAPAPQSRDRLYVVCWRRGERAPDLARWTRPAVWCPACDRQVLAVQAWKRPDRQFGRYGRYGQYWWHCPTTGCHAIIQPRVLPAAVAIDWTIPAVRIADRTDPLEPATMRRIRDGLAHYGTTPTLVPAGGTWNDDARPTHEPMRTRTTRETEGVLVPPLPIPVQGRGGVSARPVTDPARTQTTRLHDAMVVPLRRHGVARLAGGHPLMTVAAGGEHHALVSWVYAYDTGTLRPVLSEPLPTQTTVEGDALLSGSIRAEDCTFRMLEPAEIQAAMAFAPAYRVLGNRRQRVRMLGNAVTPPAARDLIAAVAEALTGQQVTT